MVDDNKGEHGEEVNAMRLGNDPQSIELFEEILRDSLTELFERLCCSDWYIREHEIVSLFTFGSLVPRFQTHGFDLTMIGIEFPVMQVDVTEKSRYGARKDIVIWPGPLMTLWKDCKLSPHMNLKDLRTTGRTPFAIIEWKVINRRIHDGTEAQRRQKSHKKDIEWLKRNLDGDIRMLMIGYAVLVTQDEGKIEVKCVKISNPPTQATDFLLLQRSSCLS